MIRMDTNLSNLSFMRSGTLSEIDILFARRTGVMVRKYFFFFFYPMSMFLTMVGRLGN